jgi:hypothetical protein
MRKASLTLLYLGGALMLIGGLGDQFINQLLEVHRVYLGEPPNSEFLIRPSR